MIALRQRLFASTAAAAQVPVELIKILRARTNARIVDCKSALLTAELDLEEAHRQLREAGLASMNKNADRATSQGVIAFAQNPFGAVLVELQSETDFVAKTDRFLHLATRLSHLALDECQSSMNWEAPDLDSLKDRAREDFTDAVLAVRENLVLKSAKGLALEPGQRIASYMHNRSSNFNEIGQIGVLLRYIGENETTADQIAMHIAAASPLYLKQDDIPKAVIEEERRVMTKQAESQGKPANITKGIVEGKLKKWKSEVTLLEQTFAVGDSSKKVCEMLEGVTIDGFVRMRIGQA